MLDATRDRNCLFDRSGYHIYANRAVGELLGRTPESIVGMNLYQIGYPYDLAQRLHKEIQTVVETGKSLEGEYSLKKPSGAIGYYEYIFVPVLDSSDRVEAVAKSTRDITERRKREQAVRETEEKLLLFADTIPQLAWMANPDGWIFWYNKRWYEYTGTTSEQMQGWGWKSVHDPAALPEVMLRWPESLARGKPFEMVFPLKGADGRFRTFLTRAVPYRDAAGDIKLWFGTNTEITPNP
jgi:PAS domain S-box-containing protein